MLHRISQPRTSSFSVRLSRTLISLSLPLLGSSPNPKPSAIHPQLRQIRRVNNPNPRRRPVLRSIYTISKTTSWLGYFGLYNIMNCYLSAKPLMSHSSTFLLPLPSSYQSTPSPTYALVVVNQSLLRSSPLLWSHAQLRLCADGGANRLYDDMPLLFPHEDASDVRKRYKPDAIKGDLDSIRKEVLDFYASLGTKIVDESHDQETTDMHKCVAYICDWAHNFGMSDDLCILVAGSLGGRFDHEMGNINVLCRFSTIRIILLSDDCLIRLLPRTHRHEIHVQSSVEGPHCGLVPIRTPFGRTTTTGLRWELNDSEMRFGGLVSTSNLVKEEKITVQSDSDLLWTITIKKDVGQ